MIVAPSSRSPVIDKTFPLRDVPEALRYLGDGRVRGKGFDHDEGA